MIVRGSTEVFVCVSMHQDLRRLPCESSSDFLLYPTPVQSRKGGRETNEDRETGEGSQRVGQDQTQQQHASETLHKLAGEKDLRTHQTGSHEPPLMVDVCANAPFRCRRGR
jgi:hypothetical protein